MALLQADNFWDLVQTPAGEITVVGLLLAIVVAFLRGWIVSGSGHAALMKDKDAQIQQLRSERDELKQIVFEGLALGEAAFRKVEEERGRRRRT